MQVKNIFHYEFESQVKWAKYRAKFPHTSLHWFPYPYMYYSTNASTQCTLVSLHMYLHVMTTDDWQMRSVENKPHQQFTSLFVPFGPRHVFETKGMQRYVSWRPFWSPMVTKLMTCTMCILLLLKIFSSEYQIRISPQFKMKMIIFIIMRFEILPHIHVVM